MTAGSLRILLAIPEISSAVVVRPCGGHVPRPSQISILHCFSPKGFPTSFILKVHRIAGATTHDDFQPFRGQLCEAAQEFTSFLYLSHSMAWERLYLESRRYHEAADRVSLR